MKKLCLMIVAIVFSQLALATETVRGLWQTVDDETGKPKSLVKIEEVDGKLQGTVVDLLIKPDDTLCKECKGDLHNKPVVGMQIISGLTKEGDAYVGRKILDPENGKTYKCKLWLEDGKLQVRGYIGFLFRTQTWNRVNEKS